MTRSARARETYPALDIIRLIAALLVVLYHLTYWWWLPSVGGDPSGKIFAATAGLHNFTRWGWVGVQVFFVLSGFVIAFSAEGASGKLFAKRRALRLFPAAWIAATVTLAILPWDGSDTVLRYLRSIVLWPTGPWISGVYWTLGLEIVFYGLVVLVITMPMGLRRLAMLLGTLSCGFWFLKVANYATGKHFDFLINSFNGNLPGTFVQYAAFFALGVFIYTAKKSGLGRFERLLFSGSIVAGLLQIQTQARVLMAQQTNIMTAFQPCLIWLALFLAIALSVRLNDQISQRCSRMSPVIRTMGLMTYPLYLVHSELGRDVTVFTSFYMTETVAVLTAIVTVILTSWLILKAEKYPRRVLAYLFDEKSREPKIASLP